MIIVNIGKSAISARARKYIESNINEWETSSRTFYKYKKTLKRIIIDDNAKEKNLLGTYRSDKREIRIYAKSCSYLDMVRYVFFHEFGHHIQHESGNYYHGYSPVTKNLPYCKEEKAAETHADYYLKLFSLHNTRLEKFIHNRIKNYEKKIKHLEYLEKDHKIKNTNFFYTSRYIRLLYIR